MAEETTSGDAYDLVLADLKAKRDQIDAAIAAIMAIRAAGTPTNQPVMRTSETPAALTVKAGAFFGMSIAEAAKQLLDMRKKPLGIQEITDGLKEGGIAFTTSTPGNTVGSVLSRQAAKGGDVVNVGRGQWALASWYPNPGRFTKKPKPPSEDNDEPGVVGWPSADPNAS